MDPATRGRLKDRFDGAAAAYAASRPGYPDAAVDWLLDGAGRSVLDLGAGSGALTRAIVRLGHCAVAAEPSQRLLTELRSVSPSVPGVRAGAERLPFGDDRFDVVTVATAFHWFDHERALPEIARVLRLGGRLSLVWNTRALEAPWTRELDRILRSVQPPDLQGHWGTASVHALDGSPLFEQPEQADFPHTQRIDRASLVDLVASRSYVIALTPADREAVLAAVAALFDAHVDGTGTLELSYLCQCWRTSVRSPAR